MPMGGRVSGATPYTEQVYKALAAAADPDTGDLNSNITGIEGEIVASNSTSTPLAADAEFVGEWVECANYAIIYLTVHADQPSATDGVCVEFSSDGTNVDVDDVYTYEDGGIGKTYSFQAPTKYFRACYTNGGVDQTEFRLQVVGKHVYGKPSSHRLQDSIVDDDDVELVKSVLSGKNPQDSYVNFGATTAGNFKVSLEEFENDVSSNSNTQLNVTPFHADGTEGALITGVDYVSGKSGVDAMTEAIYDVTYEHHEIHAGSHYYYCDYQLGEALGAVIDFILIVPDTAAWPHFTFSMFSTTGATLEFYEGSSSNADGTLITPRNNNRNSSNTSGVVIRKDPTGIVTGTRAAGYLAGGNRAAGIIIRDNELILKQNTGYLARITSLAAANNISWCAEWYDHTSKN